MKESSTATNREGRIKAAAFTLAALLAACSKSDGRPGGGDRQDPTHLASMSKARDGSVADAGQPVVSDRAPTPRENERPASRSVATACVLWEGTIGTARVVAWRETPAKDTWQGGYGYLSVGKALELRGERPSLLEERVTADAPATGAWRVSDDGDRMRGTWQAPAVTKVLPIELSCVFREDGTVMDPIYALDLTGSGKKRGEKLLAWRRNSSHDSHRVGAATYELVTEHRHKQEVSYAFLTKLPNAAAMEGINHFLRAEAIEEAGPPSCEESTTTLSYASARFVTIEMSSDSFCDGRLGEQQVTVVFDVRAGAAKQLDFGAIYPLEAPRQRRRFWKMLAP